ncbi:MAG TPA: proteasome accessory factor PafA2 family protein [Chthoniobacteraceae bacterium]|jgi:hypothetical protein|nr:proteasome accessory factor PafA2 family protein [Chthoniobacteraceae bacterium]
MPARTVMGHEMEYALVVLDRRGERLDQHGLDLLERLAPTLGPCLPWEDRGFAMPNGSRFYRDSGSNWAHLEIATAEVTNPLELVAYVEAAHHFILRAAEALRKDPLVSAVTVSCNTVDFSTRPGTCGSHESYFIPVSREAHGDREEDLPF